ncbi:MAG: prepilin-type N-terminal cleavage/methylation domain-containing protein [Candidatus Sungbacteria bacterium]|nr:prepilin-type N-terminal cleavage/methylation domain-containing protein [Candidatus Sungbacteria bacterium]
MITYKREQGFTLIELLVVISIIGLLSSVVLTSVNSARAKARDARRIADLKEMQKALEFYYDSNNAYPSSGGSWRGNCSSYGNYGISGSGGYIPDLAPTYIPVLPVDPKPVGGSCYLYNSNGTDYILITHLTMETLVGGDPSAPGNPPYIQALDRVCCIQPTIAVYSPGGRDW